MAGILAMIRTLGALVGATLKAAALAEALARRLDQVRVDASLLERRPSVYFEEWDAPMISGIGWVAELIAIAGGIEVFRRARTRKNAEGPHRLAATS